ncbi:retroviral-like aspartic protease, partial [Modestobacter lapidis]|nr:retroviral-like aspartic protease [Modestobacter lapidis]
MTSELKPLEEAPADIVFFNENPVNWSQVPDLIGDVWTDEILDKEEKLLDAVQDLFPENAPCNTITEDVNVDAESSSANEKDQPLDPEGDLPNEEPSPEALEVGRGTRSGRDYHKNYNQPSSSYVNPSGKQVVNAPSGKNNENAGPKEAFKYDLIEHFKHIPARLHILDLLRMSPQTRDSLISELQRLNADVDKHAPQVLQIEMDYRVKKSSTSSKEEKKKAEGSCIECLSVQKASSATIAFDKDDLLLGETKHNRPLYFTGYIKEMPVRRIQIDPGSALNLISTSALEELGIPPSKLSHTSVSIFGYDGSAQRPIGKIRFKLQIGDLVSEVTVYAIKTPSCYNILLG